MVTVRLKNTFNKKKNNSIAKVSFVWEKGCTKLKNEDSILARSFQTKLGEVLFVCVCDGMGGVQNGEIASLYAITKLEQEFVYNFIPAILEGKKRNYLIGIGKQCFIKANDALNQYSEIKKMKLGTTASVLILFNNQYYTFHLGDSPIYLMNRFAIQLTKEHRLNLHTLTKCMGLKQNFIPEVHHGYYRNKTSFLVATDGFINVYGRQKIMKLLSSHRKDSCGNHNKSLGEIAKRNIKRGEKDNMSAIYIEL